MSKRLTEDEMRSIIRLYESNKTVTEITKITGRSREAVTRVLGLHGLLEDEIRHCAANEARCRYTRMHKGCHWNAISPAARARLIDAEVSGVVAKCKARYASLMHMGAVLEDNKPAKELPYLDVAVKKYVKAKRESLSKCTLTTIGAFEYADGYLEAVLNIYNLHKVEDAETLYLFNADNQLCMSANF